MVNSNGSRGSSRGGLPAFIGSVNVEPPLLRPEHHKVIVPLNRNLTTEAQIASSSGRLGDARWATNREVAERDQERATTGNTSLEEVEVADDKDRKNLNWRLQQF